MLNRLKWIVLVAVIVIVVGAALYGGGYWYATQQQKEDRLAMGAQSDVLQRDLVRTQALNQLLFARLAMTRALGQLDQRNFGLANSRLKEAAHWLSQIDAQRVDVDPAALDGLRDELNGFDLNVAVDLEAQRARLLDWSARIDQMLPSAPVPSMPPSVPPQEPATAPAT